MIAMLLFALLALMLPRVPSRELVSDQPFMVVTEYDDSLINAEFPALELDGEYSWMAVEWPYSQSYVRLADGSVVSLDAFSSSDEEGAS